MKKKWTTSPSFVDESKKLSIGEKRLVTDMLVRLDGFLQRAPPYSLLIRRMLLHLWIGRNLVVSCLIRRNHVHVYMVVRRKRV